jgi:hypothetical protein
MLEMAVFTMSRGARYRVGLLIAGLGLAACTAGSDAPMPFGSARAAIEVAPKLYVGDASDNSLKLFDGATGAFQGAVIKSKAGLHGPMGLIAVEGDLIVSDQNVDTSAQGELLRYDPQASSLVERIVPHSDPNAPTVPRGVVLWHDTLFVADLTTESRPNKPNPPGRVRAYSSSGQFLADLIPPSEELRAKFYPRGLVIGPDDMLYVSNVLHTPPSIGGQVLRFNPTTKEFVGVFIDDTGGPGQLNRPEGLVFAPDGRLCITSFRADSGDTDTIRIYEGPGPQAGAFEYAIALDVADPTNPTQPRAYAQALLFGPGGKLFVPISGGGPDAGSVRRYDVNTMELSVFVPPAAQGGAMGSGWYLTFDKTNPATLAYEDN